MSEKDDNKKEAKSKIEQIRIDLEKKLAAIEKTKTNFKATDSKSEVVDNDVLKTDAIASDLDPVFEISEPIESIEDANKEKVLPIVAKPSEIIEVKSDLKKEAVITENKVSTPPKTIVAAMTKKVSNNVIEVEAEEEEEAKKGIFGYLIYGFLIALFLVIGYLIVDYMKENKNLQNEKMNQKLKEFKNKSYLDSIQLADLNSQLLDIQSKTMIDSLDRMYENELIANSKRLNKNSVVKKNYKASNKKKKSQSVQNTSVDNSVASSIVNNESGINNSDSSNQSIIDSSTSNSAESNESSSDLAKSNKATDIGKNEASSTENKAANNESKETIKSNEDLASEKPKIVKAPVYPGCEKKKSEFNRKKCLTSKMYRHVNRKFNSDIAQNSGLNDGLHQVKVSFIIDKRGYATVLTVRGESKELEQEAIRVIQTLPKMKPGTINGSKSKMQYTIPIKFIINN